MSEYKSFDEANTGIAQRRELGTYESLKYHKCKVINDNLPKKKRLASYVTVERLDGEVLVPLYEYLNYLAYKHIDGSKPAESEEKLNWLHQQLRLLDTYVNGTQENNVFLTPKSLFKIQCYEAKSYYSFTPDDFDNIEDNQIQKQIGRFYGRHSAQQFPKELRYYLFKGRYRDFEIVNSHPSILFELAKKNNFLSEIPVFQKYVEDRESLMQQVLAERREIPITNDVLKTRDDLKTDMLIKVLNNKYPHFISEEDLKSKTYYQLCLEGGKIRKKLWECYLKGKLPQFKSYLDRDPNDTLETLQVKLLTLYCQTQESLHLENLFIYLENEYIKHLRLMGKQRVCTFENTNKLVELTPEHTLSVIPFFDGVLVSSLCEHFNSKLKGIVDDFNNTYKYTHINFVEKELKSRVEYTSLEEFEVFKAVHLCLSDSSNRNYVSKYLRFLRIHSRIAQKLVPLADVLKNVFGPDDKALGYLNKELLSMRPEIADVFNRIKDHNADIAIKIYDPFLEKKTRTPEEVLDYIKNTLVNEKLEDHV
nr:hypothetical protein [Guinardia striata]